ncbi:MAG: 2-hydroxymuconate tautomerase family protein [Chloroflexi bacterium]|nr:2-hydroxymuconate tautomerase family protein [Chloroflexota bacterium]MCL5074401.1 2-hydroxymuconate tautomerase family protein [Chloroflexota bacterium]
MPVLIVEMWEGRTVEQKRRLVEALTKTVGDVLGVPNEATSIIIHEVSKQNWGLGGSLAADK